jgi:hypothetical protein
MEVAMLRKVVSCPVTSDGQCKVLTVILSDAFRRLDIVEGAYCMKLDLRGQVFFISWAFSNHMRCLSERMSFTNEMLSISKTDKAERIVSSSFEQLSRYIDASYFANDEMHFMRDISLLRSVSQLGFLKVLELTF